LVLGGNLMLRLLPLAGCASRPPNIDGRRVESVFDVRGVKLSIISTLVWQFLAI
jgi:hypothetical protein